MRIQHNLSAMNSLNNYNGNNKTLSGNLEKLSSGYRINSAADDAAGLAISEKMRSQIAGLEKAQDNANDGISLVQTAEGALTEVNSMLTRLTELATQSANGTYDDTTDRANIQEETEALLSEMDRISQSTNYNGINLLDGSLSGGGTSGTALTGASIVNYKAATSTTASALPATGAVDASDASEMNITTAETLTIDGASVTIDWTTLSSEDQATLKTNWKTNATKSIGDSAAEIMQSTINDALSAAGFSNSVTVTAKTVSGNADADNNGTYFTITSDKTNGDSSIQSSAATAVVGALTGASAKASATASIAGNADMAGDFNMNINGQNYKITTGAVQANATDVASVLQTAINDTIDNYNAAASVDEQLTKADFKVELNSDGQLVIHNGSTANISFNDDIVGSSKVAEALGIASDSSKVTGNGLTLQVGDTNKDYQKVTVSIGDMSSSGLGLKNLDLSNQTSAGNAIDTIKTAVNMVSTQRGQLGAIQNRLDYTLNNLEATDKNITAAESQIRDVDMAKEMTAYSKNNILVQAAQSMLAQANSMPQGVLQLLQ